MIGIVSSTYVVGHPQADGRHYVQETHTDDVGGVHEREYLAPVGADYAAITADRAAFLVELLNSAPQESTE